MQASFFSPDCRQAEIAGAALRISLRTASALSLFFTFGIEEGAARNASNLARDLDLTTGGVTRIIGVLEAKGWVKRAQSAYDRAEVLLPQRAEGRHELRRLTATLMVSWTEILARFAKNDLEPLVRLLTLLKQGLQTPSSGPLEAVR